ncbi:MAG TPA: hypothetical protein VEJ63_00275 [Planctomycetota bacterium]|nr:hypothetical protein [Planctomycetota bacterium]
MDKNDREAMGLRGPVKRLCVEIVEENRPKRTDKIVLFNELGYMIEEEYFDDAGKPNLRALTTYNERNERTIRMLLYADGRAESLRYEYDVENGRRTEWRCFKEDGSIYSQTKYIYAGELLKEEIHYRDGLKKERRIFHYSGTRLKSSAAETLNADGTVLYTRETFYDERGRETGSRESGMGTIQTTYNDDGLEVETLSRDEGEIAWKTEYTYLMDGARNWLMKQEKTIFPGSSKQTSKMTLRQIIYFQ